MFVVISDGMVTTLGTNVEGTVYCDGRGELLKKQSKSMNFSNIWCVYGFSKMQDHLPEQINID